MPQKPTILLASRNPGKLREIREALGELGVRVAAAEVCNVPEPRETAGSFAENAREKALYYAWATGQWCLADDSGLVVDALDGAPGVRSARYAVERCQPDADEETIAAANNAKLLEALKDVPYEARTARFVCHLALADRNHVPIAASGTVEGRIAREPKGCNGFGYDPLFFVPDLGCTMAELSPQAKNRISHRGKAVRRFAALLKDLLAEEAG